jgi:CEP19-like protein
MKGHDLEYSLLKVENEYNVNPEEDLNKLDNEELDKKKAIMDIAFNKGRIRPGDSQFEYDKRVDFVSDKPSDWDGDDGNSDEMSVYQTIPVLEDVRAEGSAQEENEDDHQECQLDLSEVIDVAEGNEEDSLEDKDPKLNVQFDIKDLENELKVDDLDDFWS